MIIRRFHKPGGERFREIRRDGAVVTLVVGKLGSAGIGRPTRYPTESDAIALVEQHVAGYLANGLEELSREVTEAERAASGPPGLSRELTLAESIELDREREAGVARRAEMAADAPRLAEERRAREEARRAAEKARAETRAALGAERARLAAGLTDWPAPPVWLERIKTGDLWGIAVFEGGIYETRPGKRIIDRREVAPPDTAEVARDALLEKRRRAGWIPWVDPAAGPPPHVAPREPPSPALDAPAAWRRIRAMWVLLSQVMRVGPVTSWRRAVRAGGKEDEHIAALDRFDSDVCPAALDVRGEALAMAMLEHLASSSSAHRDVAPVLFVDFWVASRGLTAAFESLERMECLGVYVDRERHMYPCTGVHHIDWAVRFRAWRRLRDHLDAAVARGDEVAYASMTRLMRSRFEACGPELKVAHLIAFPRERSVVAHGVGLLLAFPEFPRFGLQLLASEFDGARAKRLMQRASDLELEGAGDRLDDLVDAAGEQALEPLVFLLQRARSGRDARSSDRPRWTALCKAVTAALGRLRALAVVPLLADGFDDPELFGGLVTNALHEPAAWIDRVASAAASGGVRGTMAAAVLTWMVRRTPELRASPSGVGARRALRLATARASRGRPVAPIDHEGVPEVLRDAPWRRADAAPARPVVATPIADDAPSMVWSAVRGQRAAWQSPDASRAARAKGRTQIEIDRDVETAFDAGRDGLVKAGALDPDLLVDASPSVALAAWREVPARAWQEDLVALRGFVAHHELAALPGLLLLAEQRIALAAVLFLPFAASRIAPFASRALGAPETAEPAAAWLVAHPEAAARGLLHVLLGAPSDARDEADRALHRISRSGGRDAVMRVAEETSLEAAIVFAQICDADPSTRRPDQGTRTPSGWDALALPAPVLAGTTLALPDVAMSALGELVGTFALPPDHPWLAEIRARLEAGSLADLAREIVVRGVASGASAAASTLRAIEWFADEDGVRLVADLARAADDAVDGGRAALFLASLERLAAGSAGGTAALYAVCDLVILEHRARMLQTRSHARHALDRVARSRELDPEALRDVSVPDFGLDGGGSLVLDLGGEGQRVFRVGFDEHLEPFVRTATGERLDRLPEPTDSDDPEKAADAEVAWRRLKRDVHALSGVAIQRLEDAMCSRRAISRAHFEANVQRHPLLRHVARRLLFRAEDGAHFRIAEDGAFAGEDDTTIEIAPLAPIGIAHPLEIDAGSLAKWLQIFEDYELLQPFSQLRRPVYRHAADGLDEREIIGFPAARPIPGERHQALFRRGWALVGGHAFRRSCEPAPYDVLIDLTQPIFSAVPGGSSVRAVRFVAHESQGGAALPLREVHPVDVSEGVSTARWASEPG